LQFDPHIVRVDRLRTVHLDRIFIEPIRRASATNVNLANAPGWSVDLSRSITKEMSDVLAIDVVPEQ
jgi:hypothetical protein